MNVADIITRHAEATPDAPAVIEGAWTWSYREFDAAIWRAAAWFLRKGVAPDEVVGVSMPDSALHLVAGYALARMGAVQLSLPMRESGAVCASLARRFGVSVILGPSEAALPGVPLLQPDPAWLESDATPVDASVRAPGGDRPWKLALTSGTTGEPKAVRQTHAMHVAWRELNQLAIPLQAGERYLAVVGLDFFAGFRICTDVHWAGGAIIVGETLQAPEQMLEAVARHRVTYLYLTPMHLHRLLPAAPQDRIALPGLRRLRTGSMVVSEALRRDIMRRVTPHLVVAYGTNDVGSPFTRASGEELARFPETIGFAVPGVELQIADDADRALPAGETGRIRVRTPAMPTGYVDNPEASTRAFRDGWYYPGDLGQLSAQGALYFKGRADDLMNCDGIKIYPHEIESVLLAHPGVSEAASFPLPSAEHQDLPAAAVVLRGASTAAELRRYCAEKLGARAPHSIAVLRALPLTAAGKTDKRRLAQLIREKMERGRHT